jgi:multiple sugar transport system substrate-binding protein
MSGHHSRTRWAGVAAAAVLALLTASCSGSSSDTKGGSGGSTLPPAPAKLSGSVVMAMPGDNPGDLALRKQLANKFMAANPGVKVTFTVIPSTSYNQKVQTMIAGGKAPDIFNGGDVQIPNYVQKNYVLDLKPYVKRDKYDVSKFYPQIIDNLTYDGKLVGLTDNYDTQVMYYNTDLFKKAGVAEPTADWTWDDFVSAASKLTKGSGSAKTYGAVYDNWFAPYFDQIWADGGDPFPDNAKKCGYDSPEAVKAFTQIQDLYKKGLSPSPSAFSANGAEQQFLSGRVAMLIGSGRWSAYSLKDIHKFGWKIAPLPKGDKGRANFFHISMFAIPRASKNPEAAFAFLKYMVSEKGIKAGLANMQGIPSRPSIAESASFKNSPFNVQHNTVEPFTESLPTVHRAPSLSNFSEVQDAVTAKLSPVWNLKASPAQTLPDVCKTIAPMLQAGGSVGGG